MSVPLAALEEITDISGVAPRIEALLPTGVRHRQLRVRTRREGLPRVHDFLAPVSATAGLHQAGTNLPVRWLVPGLAKP